MLTFLKGIFLFFRSTPTSGLPTCFKMGSSAEMRSFLIMDATDPESRMQGSSAINPGQERGNKNLLLLPLAIQSLLICACAGLCGYTLFRPTQVEMPPCKDRGIYLNMKKVANYNGPLLNFSVTWNNSVELHHGSVVEVQFPGPYIFYICATFNADGMKRDLTLAQGHNNTTIELLGTSEKRCVRHQRLISLYEGDGITFSFESIRSLKELRVGLHYMLGGEDFFTPDWEN